MEKEFEIIDHTADVGIVAYGKDLNQAFANAGEALFSLITDLDKVKEVTHREVEISAPDRESLLVDWLNELIYLFDTEQLLFKRFDVQLDQKHLRAKIYGETVSGHKLKIGVKAATYHMLKIKKNNGFKVQVLFDI